MKKILYVILHGSIYKERVNNIKETWGYDKDILFYSDYDDEVNNVKKISNRTDYHSNEEKHINIINYLNENIPDYDWFLFCDDDTFVNTKKLESSLDFFETNFIHGSIIKCWPNDLNLEYCSGGAGLLIHKTILKKLENVPILNTGYSDVTLGIYVKNNNISLKNSIYFNSQPPEHYGIKDDEVNNYITFHYIKTKDMINHLLKNV